MKPKKHIETPDLFRARWDQLLHNSHQRFILADKFPILCMLLKLNLRLLSETPVQHLDFFCEVDFKIGKSSLKRII